jgi:hypothetical protein
LLKSSDILQGGQCVSPEAALLLYCARTRLSPDNVEQIRALLREEINWPFLVQAACYHAVQPLLYWHLNAVWPEAVPAATMEQLRRQFRANVQRNLFLTGELLSLLKQFDKHGAPVLPFKGPVLTSTVYGNLGLRLFGDLDLLVRKQDIPRIKDLLVSLAYYPQFRRRGASGEKDLQHDRVYRFVRGDGKCIVEAHWKFTPRFFPFPLDFEHLSDRFTSVSLAGQEATSLRPEELLLVLCVHGSKHLWDRLSWVCDIAELIRAYPELKWESVLEEAIALGAQRRLYLGLYLAKDLLRAALPEKVSQRILRDSATASLAVKVRRRLFRDSRGGFPGTFKKISLHLKTMERLRDKIQYCHYIHQIFRGVRKNLDKPHKPKTG